MKLPSGPAAHTPNPHDSDERWQLLDVHLHAVEALSGAFGSVFGCGQITGWLGRLHDVGKISPSFQRYLIECHAAATGSTPARRGGPDHKTAGALIAADCVAALALPLFGHHGGIKGFQDTDAGILERGKDPEVQQAHCQFDGPRLTQQCIRAEMAPLATTPFQMEVLLRMWFSCLVDADSLNTEAHCDPDAALFDATFSETKIA